MADKTVPAGPLRDPLPPIALIEVACRALEALALVHGAQESSR